MPHNHRFQPPREGRCAFGWVALLVLLPVIAGVTLGRRPPRAEVAAGASDVSSANGPSGSTLLRDNSWHDSLGDGFPDSARLETTSDRETFLHWFTFLAESQYYAPSKQAQGEIQDCAALIRFAYRNALMAHTSAWRESAGLLFDPGFGDVAKFNYPYGPLGRALFRVRRGPAEPGDEGLGAFAEFADSATLLRYNTFPVAHDLRAARPGDLLFFHQTTQREPFHTMLFVGNSYYQPQGSDWIVYHTGDLEGRHGELRAVPAETLVAHPDQRWRPLANNPSYLGVFRLEIVR